MQSGLNVCTVPLSVMVYCFNYSYFCLSLDLNPNSSLPNPGLCVCLVFPIWLSDLLYHMTSTKYAEWKSIGILVKQFTILGRIDWNLYTLLLKCIIKYVFEVRKNVYAYGHCFCFSLCVWKVLPQHWPMFSLDFWGSQSAGRFLCCSLLWSASCWAFLWSLGYWMRKTQIQWSLNDQLSGKTAEL